MYAHLADKFHIVQIQQPIAVVYHDGAVFGLAVKVDKTAHLLFEGSDVVQNGLLSHHFTHIGTAGGVANHAGAAAKQGDGTVSGLLHVRHNHNLNKMANVQAVGGWVKANVKGYLLFAQQVADAFICALLDVTALLQNIIYILFSHLTYKLLIGIWFFYVFMRIMPVSAGV